jgi:hypothetical protein
MTHQVRGCYGFMVIFGQQTIKQLKPDWRSKKMTSHAWSKQKLILPSAEVVIYTSAISTRNLILG